MKFSDVKKKFKNVWVLAEVIKENELNQPIEVNPITASRSRDKIYDKLATLPKNKLYTTLYTGKLPKYFLLPQFDK